MSEQDVQNNQVNNDNDDKSTGKKAGYHDTRDSYGLDWCFGDGNHHEHSPLSKLAHFVIILIALFVSVDGYYLFIKYSQVRTTDEINSNVNDTYKWFSDLYYYMDNISTIEASKFSDKDNETLNLIYNCGENLSYVNLNECKNINYNNSPIVNSIYNNIIVQNQTDKIIKVEIYNKFFTYLNHITSNGGFKNSSSLSIRSRAVNIVDFNARPIGNSEFDVINELEYKQDRANFYSANGITLSSLNDIYGSNKIMFGVVRSYNFGTGSIASNDTHIVRAVHPVMYKDKVVYYVVFYVSVDDILSKLTNSITLSPAVVLNSAGYVIASNANKENSQLVGDRMYDLAELSYAVKYSEEWLYMLAHKSGKVSTHNLTGTYLVFSPYKSLPQDYVSEQEKYWVIYSNIDTNYYIMIAVMVFIITYIFLAIIFSVFVKKKHHT